MRLTRRPVLVGLVAAAACVASCRSKPSSRRAADTAAPLDRGAARGRVVILALGGVDPDWLATWIDQGWLPNFARLRERGAYHWLRTTQPPSCEAAWTTFVTGLRPGDSGVIGPVGRDPDRAAPVPGAVDVDLAASPPRVMARRSGTAFWRVLAEAGLRVRVLWAPYEIPPEPLPAGEVLAGAGVPDLSGAGERVFLGAAFPRAGSGQPDAATSRVRLVPAAAGWTGWLLGPPAPCGGYGRMTVPLAVGRHPDLARLVIGVGGRETVVAPATWSERVAVEFRFGDVRVHGLARFLALDTGPSPVILVPPLDLDPARPWLPVSEPPDYLPALSERYGLVPTAGAPGDLGALEAGLLSAETFAADVIDDFDARREVLLGEFDRGGFDVFVAFLPTAERLTRGLYWLADPSVPSFDAAAGAVPSPALGGVRLRDAVVAGYAFLDDVVGRLLDGLEPEDRFVVLSDHGFHPCRRNVHLNAWLRREGLLVTARDESRAPEATDRSGVRDLATGVDWSRTRMYAVGHGALYVNLRGRESHGIVEPGERFDTLVERVATKLEAWTDLEAGGLRVVTRTLVHGRDFGGRRDHALPDLMVALASGYGTSAETVAGLIPEEVLEDNLTKVSVCHESSDAAETHGVLLTNTPLAAGDPGIEDIGATVLGHFGVDPGAQREGRNLW